MAIFSGSRSIRKLADVVDWGLCIGCGACYSACEKGGVQLVNIREVGIRPKFTSDECSSCVGCLAVCPGYEVDGDLATGLGHPRCESEHEFGHALEIWEGYAVDEQIRWSASSGGVLSALALYCLEVEKMKFVLHIGKDETRPWVNMTVKSRSRAELLSRAGSRYAPASPCDSLQDVERAGGRCVFIGKPCDTAAAWKMRNLRPKLDENLGVVLSFFCAGTPSEQGTLDLALSLGVDHGEIKDLRYRGEGWPGRFKIISNTGTQKFLSYRESWGTLTRYRPKRCHLCPDGLGRVADISCGDAWDRFEEDGDPGRSLIIVRTERGRQVLSGAVAAGYVRLQESGAQQVLAAQVNLLGRRKQIFGRLAAMKLLAVPSPRLRGFSLLHSWLRMGLGMQARTIIGTLRRTFRRGGWRRRPLFTR